MSPAESIRHELHTLRDQWWCFLILGIALVVLGAIAIGSPIVATVPSVVLFGFLLLAGGVIQVISSFWAGKWSGMLLHLLIGLLYSVVGYMIIDAPGCQNAGADHQADRHLPDRQRRISHRGGADSAISPIGAGCCSTAASRCCLGLMINRQWPEARACGSSACSSASR